MDTFAIAYAGLTLALVAAAMVARGNRPVWRDLGWIGVIGYPALVGAAVAVSLVHFDSISNHAWRPHEEALWFAMKGQRPPDGVFHPLEVQVLLRLIYVGIGKVFGATEASFAVSALVLGSAGVALGGAATQLLTGSRKAGFAAALLLAVYPSLAYWRTNAFHVAPPHVLFAATLLAAVVVARRPSAVNFAAWLMLGSLCLFMRMEGVGAVVATAAIPILCGTDGFWRHWKVWVPAALVAAALLAVPTLHNMGLAADREDYRLGLRFAPFFLRVPDLFRPLTSLGMLVMLALGVAAATPLLKAPRPLRRAAAALTVVSVSGIFPTIFFMSFGQRHVLAAGTAGVALGMVGLVALSQHPRVVADGPRGRRIVGYLAVGLIASVSLDSWATMMDWGSRYGFTEKTRVPHLPGLLPPRGAPSVDPDTCGAYGSAWQFCESWRNCHPPKDMSDPQLVRKMWDSSGGCVVWAVDESDGQVAGARHEWWTVVSGMYSWAPEGRLLYLDNEYEVDLHVYRMTERP